MFWDIVNLLMTSALSLDTPSIEGVIKEFQHLKLNLSLIPRNFIVQHLEISRVQSLEMEIS